MRLDFLLHEKIVIEASKRKRRAGTDWIHSLRYNKNMNGSLYQEGLEEKVERLEKENEYLKSLLEKHQIEFDPLPFIHDETITEIHASPPLQNLTLAPKNLEDSGNCRD